MAEGDTNCARLCTAEEEVENEVDTIQSIFEGQIVLLNSSEYVAVVYCRQIGPATCRPFTFLLQI
jgi:hypothetical protein